MNILVFGIFLTAFTVEQTYAQSTAKGALSSSPVQPAAQDCQTCVTNAIDACQSFGAYNQLQYPCYSYYIKTYCHKCGGNVNPNEPMISLSAATIWENCINQNQCYSSTIPQCKECVAPDALVCGPNPINSESDAQKFCPDLCKVYQNGQGRQYLWDSNHINKSSSGSSKGYAKGVLSCADNAPNCGCSLSNSSACNCYVHFHGEK
ncbi:MAG: hypothetical protein JSR85_03605 [Proteobacteria bacterium]|nr:hypothetical protein [Pseudomonadota bacterium]